ncbi:hypothetical protein [uncultured Paludibaculum sp.]|uniref:hypothetical protein n=1 Tax=uncultured Paludibaculum sp. TaxID=1765020 RepID=UPI002AAC1F90|nr:hypothetical protein [uncultured Paludibaculum sp.]
MYRILYRHFLAQFFENDLVAPQGELRAGMAGVLGFVAMPGLLLPLWMMGKYSSLIAFIRMQRFVDRDGATWSDKIIYLSLALVIPALAMLLKWDSLFPTRLDHAIFAPMPLRLSRILLAKAAALGTFVALFALAVNAASTILFPLAVLGDTGTLWDAVRYIGAHFLATMAISLCACTFLIALQGIGLTTLGLERFRGISAALQFAVLTGLLTLFLLCPSLSNLARKLHTLPQADWLPPFWFLGLYEVLLGKADAAYRDLAATALQALGICSFTAVATYALSYRRHFRRIPETLERGSSFAAPVWNHLETLAGRFTKDRRRIGLLMFVLQTFIRSHTHRLLFGVFLALASAVILNDVLTVTLVTSSETEIALSAPLIVSFFLLTGFRFLYEIPADLPAHWLFRIAAPPRPISFHKLMLAFVLVVTTPINFLLLPLNDAVIHSVNCGLLAVILAEALFVDFHKIPFTCTFGAAKWNVTYALFLWFLVFIFYTWVAIRVEMRIAFNVIVFSCACAALLAVVYWLHRRRDALWAEDPTLRFHDGQAPAVQTLDLNG